MRHFPTRRFEFFRDFIISRTSILLLVVLLLVIVPATNHLYGSKCFSGSGHALLAELQLKHGPVTISALSYRTTTRSATNLWFSFRRAVSGWWTCPPQIIITTTESRKKKKKRHPKGLSVTYIQIAAAKEYLKESYSLPLWRSLFLLDLWLASGQLLPELLILLPSLEWLLSLVSVAWPWFGQLTETRVTTKSLNWLRVATLWVLGGLIVWQVWDLLLASMQEGQIALVGGLIVSGQQKNSSQIQPDPKVEILKIEGGHRIDLTGQFYLTVKDDDPFWQRMTLIFLLSFQQTTNDVAAVPHEMGDAPIWPSES